MSANDVEATRLDQEADFAVSSGDMLQALSHLKHVVRLAPSVARWTKFGSLLAACGDAKGALEAVHKALAMAPLDFTALLSKASLLERMGVSGSGEAYDRALAQRPRATVVPQLERMIAHAESAYADYIAAHDHKLAAAVAAMTLAATPEESRRIDRFRTNAIRQTKVYHSEPSHFHFPGLVECEFHDRTAFPWLFELEAKTDAITEEFLAVAAAEHAELVPYIRYADHEPLMQWEALNNSRNWTSIHLSQFGKTVPVNIEHCPYTVELLSRLPQPRIAGCSPNAMFSMLAPRMTIPPHTGVANTRLVCHLPLIVPQGCWFRVGAETRSWERGKAFVFDDTTEPRPLTPATSCALY